MQQAQTPAAAPAGKSSSFFPQQGKGNFFTPAAPVIQRAIVNDCTDDERTAIDSAVSEAFRMTTRAIAIMDTVPLPGSVADAMFLAFRDTSDESRTLVRERLGRLLGHIRTSTYQCVSRGEEGFASCTGRDGSPRAAYVTRTGTGADRTYSGNVMVCYPEFASHGLQDRAKTIIHELAHYYLGMEDMGYFHLGCIESPRPETSRDETAEDSGTAGDAPSTRLSNADSYGCFVYFLTAMPARDMADRAAGYRGDNLSIGAPNGTTIYTQTTFEQDPIFQIEGIPDMGAHTYHKSGMRMQWKLQAGGLGYKMMSKHDEAASHLFDKDNTQAYVSHRVRSILESNRETSGEVVCRIMLPPQNIAGNTAPVTIEKRLNVRIVQGMDPFNGPI